LAQRSGANLRGKLPSTAVAEATEELGAGGQGARAAPALPLGLAGERGRLRQRTGGKFAVLQEGRDRAVGVAVSAEVWNSRGWQVKSSPPSANAGRRAFASAGMGRWPPTEGLHLESERGLSVGPRNLTILRGTLAIHCTWSPLQEVDAPFGELARGTRTGGMGKRHTSHGQQQLNGEEQKARQKQEFRGGESPDRQHQSKLELE